jgi:ABC-type transporter Mla subunit MlaD
VLVGIAILVLLLSGGGNSNHYRLLFETGGQLVNGNQVLIGGTPVGSVDNVKLTETGQAQVDISVNRPMHEGTSAIIRATSLSGIANRYISIQPGRTTTRSSRTTRSSPRSTPPARSTSISSSTRSAGRNGRLSGTSSRDRRRSTPATGRRRT